MLIRHTPIMMPSTCGCIHCMHRAINGMINRIGGPWPKHLHVVGSMRLRRATQGGARRAGGRVLCHGPTCSVRFENCRFSKCGVVAIGGAGVTFINCLIKHADIGVYANGPGTSLTVRKLEAVDCKQVTPPPVSPYRILLLLPFSLCPMLRISSVVVPHLTRAARIWERHETHSPQRNPHTRLPLVRRSALQAEAGPASPGPLAPEKQLRATSPTPPGKSGPRLSSHSPVAGLNPHTSADTRWRCCISTANDWSRCRVHAHARMGSTPAVQ